MAKRRSTTAGAGASSRQTEPTEELDRQAAQPATVDAGDKPLTMNDLLAVLNQVNGSATTAAAPAAQGVPSLPTPMPTPAPVIVQAPKQKGLLVQYWWMLLVAGLFGYIYFNKSTAPEPSPDDKPTPDVVADPDLVVLAKRAFRTRAAAETFANACEQVAGMVQDDGESRNEGFMYAQRAQVSERLVAMLTRTAQLAKLDVNMDELAEFVIAAWDEEKEFPQANAALSKEDREKAIRQFRALAAAAREVT